MLRYKVHFTRSLKSLMINAMFVESTLKIMFDGLMDFMPSSTVSSQNKR
jgi:hypothetical protein